MNKTILNMNKYNKTVSTNYEYTKSNSARQWTIQYKTDFVHQPLIQL